MIGIIAAMDKELNTLYSNMENRSERTICGIQYSTGEINGKNVVVSKCGVGKINAAICTQVMLANYKVDVLFNTGVCGALSKELNVYDYVLSSECYEHDMDTSLCGDPIGLMVLGDEQRRDIPTSKETLAKVKPIFDEFGLNYKVGGIASGDLFVGKKEQKQRILEHFPKAIACDMEAVAIAHVAYLMKTPVLVVRAVSDTADDSSSVDYPTFVKKVAEELNRIVFELIGKYE